MVRLTGNAWQGGTCRLAVSWWYLCFWPCACLAVLKEDLLEASTFESNLYSAKEYIRGDVLVQVRERIRRVRNSQCFFFTLQVRCSHVFTAAVSVSSALPNGNAKLSQEGGTSKQSKLTRWYLS